MRYCNLCNGGSSSSDNWNVGNGRLSSISSVRISAEVVIVNDDGGDKKNTVKRWGPGSIYEVRDSADYCLV